MDQYLESCEIVCRHCLAMAMGNAGTEANSQYLKIARAIELLVLPPGMDWPRFIELVKNRSCDKKGDSP
jgi:hypothetical protein